MYRKIGVLAGFMRSLINISGDQISILFGLQQCFHNA